MDSDDCPKSPPATRHSVPRNYLNYKPANPEPRPRIITQRRLCFGIQTFNTKPDAISVGLMINPKT